MPKPENNGKFWMVIAESGSGVKDNGIKYQSKKEAMEKAEGCAILYGCKFFVLEAVYAIKREVFCHPLIDPKIIQERAKEYDDREE